MDCKLRAKNCGGCPPLGWMGRHSLVLYLLHQPVILGVLTVAFRLVRAG